MKAQLLMITIIYLGLIGMLIKPFDRKCRLRYYNTNTTRHDNRHDYTNLCRKKDKTWHRHKYIETYFSIYFFVYKPTCSMQHSHCRQIWCLSRPLSRSLINMIIRVYIWFIFGWILLLSTIAFRKITINYLMHANPFG